MGIKLQEWIVEADINSMQTAGSIVGPAYQSFLVGIKPTVGLVSRTGVIPISVSQDTPGPIARTVTDAAIILGALTGIDDKDNATLLSKERSYGDYTPFLDADFLQQARIGIPRHYYKNLDDERLAIMEAAISTLKDAGATIVDDVSLHVEHNNWNNDVICYEFKTGLDQYLSQLSDSVPAARLRYPLITVPAGYSSTGVVDSDGDSTKGPFGVVFSGKAFSEPTLIQIAYGFEQATNYRYPPELV